MKRAQLTALSPALLMVLILAPMPVLSEVLLIDAIAEAPPNSPAGLPRPSVSMNMDRVLERYGEPTMRYEAVGEPPITRWDYPGYSVYFEHELVLNTVVHR